MRVTLRKLTKKPDLLPALITSMDELVGAHKHGTFIEPADPKEHAKFKRHSQLGRMIVGQLHAYKITRAFELVVRQPWEVSVMVQGLDAKETRQMMRMQTHALKECGLSFGTVLEREVENLIRDYLRFTHNEDVNQIRIYPNREARLHRLTEYLNICVMPPPFPSIPAELPDLYQALLAELRKPA